MEQDIEQDIDQENKTKLEIAKSLYKNYVLPVYNPQDICFTIGEGSFLYDETAKKYIDFVSGIAVNSLGHNSEGIKEEILLQSDKILVSDAESYSEHKANLAEALVQHSFAGKVVFTHSGTEANEVAYRLASLYGKDKSKTHYVSLENSFHGRSLASMTLTGKAKIREGFGTLLREHSYIPRTNNIEELNQVFKKIV